MLLGFSKLAPVVNKTDRSRRFSLIELNRPVANIGHKEPGAASIRMGQYGVRCANIVLGEAYLLSIPGNFE